MIKKFKKKFLYKVLANSFSYKGNSPLNEPRILEFFEENTDHFSGNFGPTPKWDKLVNVKKDSIMLLLDKVTTKCDYVMMYKFFLFEEIKIIELLYFKHQENSFYEYFEELTEQ